MQLCEFVFNMKNPASLGKARTNQGRDARSIPVGKLVVESPGAWPLEKFLRLLLTSTQLDYAGKAPPRLAMVMHDLGQVSGSAWLLPMTAMKT